MQFLISFNVSNIQLNRGVSELVGDQRSRGSECSNIRLCMPPEINISTRAFYECVCQCFIELHPSDHGFLLSDYIIGHYNLYSHNMVELKQSCNCECIDSVIVFLNPIYLR